MGGLSEPLQSLGDRRDRADAGVEHQHRPRPMLDEARRDLAHDGNESGLRQRHAAGIGGEGRIGAIGYRRPDQGVVTSAPQLRSQPPRQPFGLDPVGAHGHVQPMLLGAGADRQDRRGSGCEAVGDLVPDQQLDPVLARAQLRAR